jgi:hypothetical protein
MSTNPPTISSRGLPRRSFLMAMGSTILGSFLFPTPSSAAGSAPSAAGAAAEARVAGRVRRLLAWLETFDEDKEPHVMSWYPETDEEKAEAQRFFEIAMWRSWRTLEELHAILRQPGPWLIRQNNKENYMFLSTTDPKVMLDTERDEAFNYHPSVAVQLTSEQALELIPLLMDKGYGNWTGGAAYLEPVKPEDALTNFRALRYPVK